MLSSFIDVSDFVYNLERTGRDTQPLILDDNEPDTESIALSEGDLA